MSNITWMENATNPADYPTYVNEQTGGVFAVCLLVCAFIIIMVTMRRYGHALSDILIYEGAAGMIIIVLMILKNWIGFGYIMLPVMLLFAGIISKAISGD